MQTSLPLIFLETEQGQEADRILRACVHCGFCNATCPTFLLTGNELDSPRGRIYLIKEMLEGGPCSSTTQQHLDRCLTCLSCETTCPSNVQYHRLLNIGREHVEGKVSRSWWMSGKRFLLRKIFANKRYFKTFLGAGRLFKPLLPGKLAKNIPEKVALPSWPQKISERKMIILNGCVQEGISPQTNVACARVLAKLGIQAITLRKEGCCGALAFHLNAQEEGLSQAKHNIDLLCEHLEQGVEAIVSTASGCGSFIKEYAELLEKDEGYAKKARRVTQYCKDISEVIEAEDLSLLVKTNSQKIAFHCPCSLNHGQKLKGSVEEVLRTLGFSLADVPDQHLCCGSAGTYSLLQPELAGLLQRNKITALESDNPDYIVSANVGCQNHLNAVSSKPVKHWIEFIDEGIKHG